MAIPWNGSRRAAKSIFETIGRTPMVRLNAIPNEEGVKGKILVKLEWFSPSGSLKDRIYYTMITKAINRGKPAATSSAVE